MFLIAFSVFNLLAAAGAAAAGVRLLAPEGREGWASRRLLAISQVMCWGLTLIGVAATLAAWALAPGQPRYAPLILVPIAWIVAMGVIFAIVDFAEDGVFDFGRGPPPPRA